MIYDTIYDMIYDVLYDIQYDIPYDMKYYDFKGLAFQSAVERDKKDLSCNFSSE